MPMPMPTPHARRTLLSWSVAGPVAGLAAPPPAAAGAPPRQLEWEPCSCPALAAPARLEQLGEAARRDAAAASFGDEARLAAARRLEWRNHYWCLAWRLQAVFV